MYTPTRMTLSPENTKSQNKILITAWYTHFETYYVFLSYLKEEKERSNCPDFFGECRNSEYVTGYTKYFLVSKIILFI